MKKKILNLPKWNNYNLRNNSVTDYSKNIINYNNSILIMFNWKDLIKNGKISPDCFNKSITFRNINKSFRKY